MYEWIYKVKEESNCIRIELIQKINLNPSSVSDQNNKFVESRKILQYIFLAAGSSLDSLSMISTQKLGCSGQLYLNC